VLINRAMLKKYWQRIDANPIGEFITIAKGMGQGMEELPTQIIGVVAASSARSQFYMPLLTIFAAWLWSWRRSVSMV